jgi:putative nucleotidyltransferase with HDIG domain
VIIPLLVVSYLTFRTAMGRAEDSYNHLAELNRLYLSTIETLAMAIDAKDQITHGHIRRVQAYAVGLAKTLGVTDEKLLKAIEAAALLHDMGKLAVPEHILNKPGKLTPAEFEKMKLHASVGADILSAIDFPYPVVPIVRHHHENWNGTGYPDGIKGTDIPIGARILSVVDCFDALTSDRPYRPRLGDEEALTILTERRGSMYDPLVVDTFIRVYAEIAPDQSQLAFTMKGIEGSTARGRADRSPSYREEENHVANDIPELESALAGHRTSSEIAEIVSRQIRRRVPFSLSIMYMYDVRHDQLVAEHVIGEAGLLVNELRIPRGERLSGWVAANRQSILNSDPALDLGEISRLTTPPLRTTVSVPLIAHNELLGVLSLYSSTERFTDHQRVIVETAGQFAANSLSNLRESIVVRA